MKKIIITGLIIGSLAIGVLLTRAIFLLTEKRVPMQSETYVIPREEAVKNCVDAFGMTYLTKAQENQYCGCSYDTGVSKYGGIEWTKMLIDLEKTDKPTPQILEVTNKCKLEL